MSKKHLIGTIVFNIVETYIILILGHYTGIDLLNVIYIMLLFMLSKSVFGKTLHYKKWYKCLIASTCILVSLYFVCKFSELQSFVLTLISSYFMTQSANINIIEFVADNLYHYKTKDEPSKFQILIDYIKYKGLSDEYLEAEKLLEKKIDAKTFAVYKRFFINGFKYKEISKEFDLDNPRIVERLDKCYFYITGRLGI